MKRLFQYILMGIALGFVIIQFFQIDKSAPSFKPENDFLAVEEVDERTQLILKEACYDCHSNETVYPWYTSVQPIAWRVAEHIEHGREHLNFSDWGMLPKSEKKHAIHEIVEVMEEGEMPLKDYTLVHAEARLTKEDQNHLIQFVKGLKY